MKKEYILRGTVYNPKDKSPLEGANVSFGGVTTKTNSKGKYKLKVEIEVQESSLGIVTAVDKSQKLKISHSDISLIEKVPFNEDGTVKETSSLIKAEVKNIDTKKLAEEARQQVQETVSKAIPPVVAASYEMFASKSLKEIAKELLFVLLPMIIGLLIKLGITKLQNFVLDKLKDELTCPDPKKIKSLIAKRDKIVDRLNSIYKVMDSMVKVMGVVTGIATIFLALKNVILSIPIPTAVGPPVVAVPIGTLLNQANKVEKFEKLIQRFTTLSANILASLVLIKSILKSIISILGVLDSLLQECTDEPLKELNPELLESLKEEEEELVTSINGFTLEVIEDFTAKTDLKPKYAVAKDSQGVIVLKGELSYSADEQILMDELAFYIKNNNLKAI